MALSRFHTGGPMTLFAPTNDAFNKLPEGTIQKLLADPAELRKILSMHVVSGAIAISNLKDGNLTAVDGSSLRVHIGDGKGKLITCIHRFLKHNIIDHFIFSHYCQWFKDHATN